jgi:diguanylate cyclase (GGDEF)-like protein
MNLKDWLYKLKKELQEEINILLYEPDPFIFELLRDFLREYDFKIESSPNLKDILKKIGYKNFQILIMAIEGDKEAEDKIISEVKKLNKDILIFCMVDIHKDIDISELFTKGADEVIFKPFSLGEFKARLLRLLKEYYFSKKIERYVVEDGLTGVFNRRYFEIALKEEVYRALRQGYPLSLLMIDLDKFKWYNDHYGHYAGDRVLIGVGETLCSSTRAGVDKVCRYGGDEFVVILPHTDWKGALRVVERIFKNWEALGFEPVTLSVGVAELINKGSLDKSTSDLIKRADEAMYKAKKIEGNTFEVDEESLKLSSGEGVPEGDLSFQALQ